MAVGTVGEKANVLNKHSKTFEERAAELEKRKQYEEKQARLAKNSPFSRWSQFNLEHTKELMWLALKHPKAHAILYFLVDQMDNYNAVVCSYKVLQDVLDVGQATIARNIKILKDNGFVTILKSGTSNVYCVNDSVYWKSWGNKRQYSKFPANVLLSLDEQDEQYKKLTLSNLTAEKLKHVEKEQPEA